MNPPAPVEGDVAPSVAGVRVRPALTFLLYLLLAASAAAALSVQSGAVGASDEARRSAPWVFLAFAVGFGAYRLALASVKKYSAGKAFFQVGIAALFCMVLFLGNADRRATQAVPGDLKAALADPSPAVRGLAAELARYRPEGVGYAHALVLALKDADPKVREVAHASLVSINAGQDLGPEGDEAAWQQWAAKFP